MERARRVLYGFVLITLTLGFAGLGGIVKAADDAPDANPGRKATLVVNYTQYQWWIIRWSNNEVLCQVLTDHAGLPTGSEILQSCGSAVFKEWRSTPPCQPSEQGAKAVTTCSGVYFFLVSEQPADKNIVVDLPQAAVYVNLAGCTPTFPQNLCKRIPSLQLTGEEPLPNQHITAVHAIAFGKTYDCPGSTCDVPLQPTPLEGTTVEFWADSSYGDSTPHFTAQVRVIDTGFTVSPNQRGWYVDVLSTQWRGRQIASCAQTWGSFPPIGGPPSWLLTPETPILLASDRPYSFLAGRLISKGVVDASGCPNGGLLANGYADACGLEKALPVVQTWQNQFDNRIIEVAKTTGVPAQLMKNLFAQESQFWPGIFNSDHLGLGHITENGAETILLWNPSFFEQFCPLVLDASVCQKGYVQLDDNQQAALRGALALQAKTDCPSCPTGIDLTNANFSIDLFARTLQANCEQVGQEVYNATKKTPGSVSNYEDLWRYTLANYHAGPGCLSYALFTTWSHGEPLAWENVSKYFTPVCQGVVSYVNQIAK